MGISEIAGLICHILLPLLQNLLQHDLLLLIHLPRCVGGIPRLPGAYPPPPSFPQCVLSDY